MSSHDTFKRKLRNKHQSVGNIVAIINKGLFTIVVQDEAIFYINIVPPHSERWCICCQTRS
jgi:hypothetical protein